MCHRKPFLRIKLYILHTMRNQPKLHLFPFNCYGFCKFGIIREGYLSFWIQTDYHTPLTPTHASRIDFVNNAKLKSCHFAYWYMKPETIDRYLIFEVFWSHCALASRMDQHESVIYIRKAAAVLGPFDRFCISNQSGTITQLWLFTCKQHSTNGESVCSKFAQHSK